MGWACQQSECGNCRRTPPWYLDYCKYTLHHTLYTCNTSNNIFTPCTFHLWCSGNIISSLWIYIKGLSHRPLTRYVKLSVAHAPGMPGTFSHYRLQRKPLDNDPGMHHGMCVTHVPWCMLGSLTHGGGEKRFRHPRCIRNRQFYVSGKRPISAFNILTICWVRVASTMWMNSYDCLNDC